MAIDSAEKRRAAAGVPFGLGVTPTADKDGEWRAQVAWSFGAPIYVVPPPETGAQWAMVYSLDSSMNETLVGIIVDLTDLEITEGVGSIGLGSFKAPLTSAAVNVATLWRLVKIYVENEGHIWTGRVLNRTKVIEDGGGWVEFELIGQGVELQSLDLAMVPVTSVFDESSVADAMSDIFTAISTPAWTGATAGSGFVAFSDTLDRMTVWQALERLALKQNGFLAVSPTAREVTISRDEAASGITLINADVASPASSVGLIDGPVRIMERGQEVINTVVPEGARAGDVVLDLGLSTRSSPYTIASYIKNRPSVTQVVEWGNLDAVVMQVTNLVIEAVGRNTAVVLGLAIDTDDVLNGVTCGQRPMERIAIAWDAANNSRLEIWIATGVSGRNQISLAWETETAGSPLTVAIAVALQDVDQRDPYDVQSGGISGSVTSSTPGTGNVSTVASDLCLGFLRNEDVGTTVSGRGSGQSELGTHVAAIINGSRLTVDEQDGTGSTVNFDWTLSASEECMLGAIAIHGFTTHYIEDTASEAAYRISRTRVISEKASQFVGGTAAQGEDAANSLYDYGAAVLGRGASAPVEYDFPVSFLPGKPTDWAPGDTFDVIYREEGVAVDATLYCVRRTQRYDAAGARHWNLVMSTQPVKPKTDVDLLQDQLRRLLALEAL